MSTVKGRRIQTSPFQGRRKPTSWLYVSTENDPCVPCGPLRILTFKKHWDHYLTVATNNPKNNCTLLLGIVQEKRRISVLVFHSKFTIIMTKDYQKCRSVSAFACCVLWIMPRGFGPCRMKRGGVSFFRITSLICKENLVLNRTLHKGIPTKTP